MPDSVIERIEKIFSDYVHLYEAAQPDRLSELASQAAALVREVPADAGSDAAARLCRIAMGYSRAGSLHTALALLEKVLDLLRQTLPPEHHDVLRVVQQIGILHGQMGHHPEAEKWLSQARETASRGLSQEDELYLDILGSLGVLYSRMEKFAAAEPLLERVVELRRATVGDRAPSYAQSVANLALLYDRMGRYDKAEPLFRKSVEIQRAVADRDTSRLEHALGNLATCCLTMGSLAEAEKLVKEALGLARRRAGEFHPDVALHLGNLGSIYGLLGDLAGSLRCHQEELQIREAVQQPGDPAIAVTLANLADLYHRNGEFDAAEECYLRALRIQQDVLLPFHHDLMVTKRGLAKLVADARNDMVQAESLMQYVLKTQQSYLEPGHPDLATTEAALADLYCRSGKFDLAEPLIEKALASRRQKYGEEHPEVAWTLRLLIRVAMATGRRDEALSLAKAAEAIEDVLQSQQMSFGPEQRRLAYVKRSKSLFYESLTLAQPPGAAEAETARWALELVWKRKAIGAEALAAQREAVLGGHYPALAPDLQRLSALRTEIAKNSMADAAGFWRSLQELGAERDELEDRLARAIPAMSRSAEWKDGSRKAIAEALPPGSALVEFVRLEVRDFHARRALHESEWQPAHYLAFVLAAGEPDGVRMIDLGDAGAIDRLVASYRAKITGEHHLVPEVPGRAATGSRDGALRAGIAAFFRSMRPREAPLSEKTYLEDSVALRKALFDPLKPSIEGRSRLFLAPDGALARLPFEVLSQDACRFLIDDYTISYVVTGRDILRFGRESNGEAAPAVVVADPNYDLHIQDPASAGTPFARLQGTGREGCAVAELLGVRPWLQDEPLELLLKKLRSPRIVHFATHGFFIPAPITLETAWTARLDAKTEIAPLSNPLIRSGLALTGANTWMHAGSLPPEAEDGILTAEDVTALDLLATELVVLSACDTGLGDVQAGEGILGLSRSFAIAGAHTLVMSLWSVADAETCTLVEELYRRLMSGEARVEALKEAQLALKKEHPEPFFWGAFICQGDPGPLSSRK